MEKTLYGLLGLTPSASQNDLDKAYQAFQAKLDPDAPENQGNTAAEMQLKAIREAYTLLSDPDRRGAYDASLAYRVLDLPPSREKPRWSTNRILIFALSGLIGFAVINQAVVQWQALRLSKAAMEGNSAFREEVAERERAMTMGLDPDAPAAGSEAMKERQRLLEEQRLERQQRYEEEKRERELQYAEERQKRELEANRRYADQISSDVSRSVAEGQRRLEYERQNQEAAQREAQERTERAAMQRMEAEKQRLREMEYQNRR